MEKSGFSVFGNHREMHISSGSSKESWNPLFSMTSAVKGFLGAI